MWQKPSRGLPASTGAEVFRWARNFIFSTLRPFHPRASSLRSQRKKRSQSTVFPQSVKFKSSARPSLTRISTSEGGREQLDTVRAAIVRQTPG